MIICGDLLYAKSKYFPTENETTTLMNVFKDREYLSRLPIYHVLGNHDRYYDYQIYLNFSNQHSYFMRRPRYYSELYNLKDGSNKKLGLIFLESTNLKCSHNISDHTNCTTAD